MGKHADDEKERRKEIDDVIDQERRRGARRPHDLEIRRERLAACRTLLRQVETEEECREAIRELLDERSPEFAAALAIWRAFRRSYRRS
jgi:hypothetical protein